MISKESKLKFASIYLLERIINKPETFSIYLDSSEEDLDPILNYLLSHSWIEIKKENTNEMFYAPTLSGRSTLEQFLYKYQNFIRHFDIYAAVDLEKGEFALSHYDSFIDKENKKWVNYLKQDRWEDLRLTVCEYKEINLIEVVFMSFLSEGKFGWSEKTGWQFDLLLGSIWKDIFNIVENSIKINELAYEEVSGEDVIEDVILQGALILKEAAISLEQDDHLFNHKNIHSDDYSFFNVFNKKNNNATSKQKKTIR